MLQIMQNGIPFLFKTLHAVQAQLRLRSVGDGSVSCNVLPVLALVEYDGAGYINAHDNVSANQGHIQVLLGASGTARNVFSSTDHDMQVLSMSGSEGPYIIHTGFTIM
jgi:hypothetical protein